MLNRLCPELKGQHTCCSTDQLIAFSAIELFVAPLTKRCPACWHNLRRLFCQLTCNPDQSVYMDPIKVDNSTGKPTILAINYYVSPTFKQGLFDSCKDVRKGLVLSLFCGTSAKKCTAEKLLRYMGNTGNGYAPFDIYYPESLIDNLSWMDVTVFKCNKPFIDPQTQKEASTCTCTDCAASCKFRTEQLTITATHPRPAGYDRYGDGKWIPFGPVFHLDLLNQVIFSARSMSRLVEVLLSYTAIKYKSNSALSRISFYLVKI